MMKPLYFELNTTELGKKRLFKWLKKNPGLYMHIGILVNHGDKWSEFTDWLLLYQKYKNIGHVPANNYFSCPQAILSGSAHAIVHNIQKLVRSSMDFKPQAGV